MTAYSFLDVNASIVGPGGAINLGMGAGNSDEGISYEMTEDKTTLTTGADGSFMHSLHAAQSGAVTARYLKTSPVNQLLSVMYDIQRSSSALWGQNTIVINDPTRGDVVTCVGVAFRRNPNNTYAKDGNMIEWAFIAGRIDPLLGTGSPSPFG